VLSASRGGLSALPDPHRNGRVYNAGRRTAWRALAMGLALAASLGAARGEEEAQDPGLSKQSDSKQWWREFDVTVSGAFADWHLYAKDGLRIDHGDLRLKLNASLFLDAGDIQANDAVDSAFPALPGKSARLTRARATLRGWLRDRGDFKLQLEFAQKPQIKDMWVRFRPLPYVGRLKVGNMKEPVSLDNLTAGSDLTFMTRALPALAFAPGRNIGISTTNTALDERMTWSIGAFWNTESFDSFGGANDALGNSIGSNLTGRLTFLPRYADDGRELVHLGLAFSDQRYRNDTRLRAEPETALTDDDLVDTGKFRPTHAVLVNPEFALVSGPWSFQTETFYNAFRLQTGGGSRLWGLYGFATYLLTGESRHYDRAAGVFDGVRPARNFDWGSGGWGAWEVALRLSHVDLNGGVLDGGRQTGLTAALNWYLDERVRAMLNYGVEWIGGRGVAPAIDGGRTNILQVRLAIDL
jgi:phosphate-selective porin OprO/OprP